MTFVRLLPPILSLFLLSAHFSRLGYPLISIIFLLLPLLLIIKNKWVVRLIQFTLVLGTVEWIRSLFYYVNQRQSLGAPYFRLVIIIGVVAFLTGLSALVFRNKKLKESYDFQ